MRDQVEADDQPDAGRAASSGRATASHKPGGPRGPGGSGRSPARRGSGAVLRLSERSPWSILRLMLVLLCIALLIALLIKNFVVQPFFIPSGSMEDTLLVGDKVLVNKIVYHLRPIHTGDIVVFNATAPWLPPVRPPP